MRTIDLLQLFSEQESALKSIDLTMVVDDTTHGSLAYTGQQVIDANYVLQSPVYNLQGPTGTFYIMGTARFRELPIRFCLVFEYVMARGKTINRYPHLLPIQEHQDQELPGKRRPDRSIMALQQSVSTQNKESECGQAVLIDRESTPLSTESISDDEMEFERRIEEANRELVRVKAEIKAIRSLQAERAEAKLERSRQVLSLKRKEIGQ